MAAQGTHLEHEIFSKLPWCHTIMEDPEFVAEPPWSRFYVAETEENKLLARTLKTSDTIEGWYSLYRRPTTSNGSLKDEVKVLLALRPGLNGYPRVCHGGITATVLDEIMSILVAVCRESQGLPPDNVTADLRIKYVKPVPTPAVVLVKAKIGGIQKGRKYFVGAEMVDDQGRLLTSAEGLFISVQKEKL